MPDPSRHFETEERRVLALAFERGAIDDLGPLSALAGVRTFPARAKCATLPWQALFAAVRSGGQSVSTE